MLWFFGLVSADQLVWGGLSAAVLSCSPMSCSRCDAATSGPGSGLAAKPCQISGGAFCLPELTCCFLLNDPAGNVRNDEAQAGPAV
jgi:hypothetical protein